MLKWRTGKRTLCKTGGGLVCRRLLIIHQKLPHALEYNDKFRKLCFCLDTCIHSRTPIRTHTLMDTHIHSHTHTHQYALTHSCTYIYTCYISIYLIDRYIYICIRYIYRYILSLTISQTSSVTMVTWHVVTWMERPGRPIRSNNRSANPTHPATRSPHT